MADENDRNLIYGVAEASLADGVLVLPVSKKGFLTCSQSGAVSSIETSGLLRNGLCLTLINTSSGTINFSSTAAKGTSVAREISPDGAASLVRVANQWRII